jgi:multidrug efflux pump
MMGGIIVGTLLTLFFLPALYVAWFRIEPSLASQSTFPVAVPAPSHA